MPGKPLELIAGRSMIEHVYSRVSEARGIERVIVATDDERIASEVRQFGGEAALTGQCRTGTDRVAQAVAKIECDIVVNVQGDEPLIPPQMVEEVVKPFSVDNTIKMTSLKRTFRPDEDAGAPEKVKVVTDLADYALYFSRSLVPFLRNPPEKGPFLHVGIYAYTCDFLMKFASWPSTPLEIAEGLEQLRVLERGQRIKVPTTEYFSSGVDTVEDLERARRLLEQ